MTLCLCHGICDFISEYIVDTVLMTDTNEIMSLSWYIGLCDSHLECNVIYVTVKGTSYLP